MVTAPCAHCVWALRQIFDSQGLVLEYGNKNERMGTSNDHFIWHNSFLETAFDRVLFGHSSSGLHEVRTLTVRLGRDQCRALRKLPSGVDTLLGCPGEKV